MTRLYVTGTDTGVGKTFVTAALAHALAARSGSEITIVKLVQTGVAPDETGDAERAATFAGCGWRELRRFAKPADPWSAAHAEGRTPPAATELAGELAAIAGDAIVEGSGGAAVPLNPAESISDVAKLAACAAVLVVGLRLGCISHALLTLDYLAARAISVRGVVFNEPWGPVDDAYRADVARVLEPRARTAYVPFLTGRDVALAGAHVDTMLDGKPAVPRR